MMEIKLTVEILGIPDAINNLAAAIRGQAVTSPAVVSTKVTSVIAPTQSVNPTPAAVSESIPQNPAPAPVAPTEDTIAPISTLPSNAPVQPSAPAPTPEKKITAEDISRAGASLVDQGKMADVINLLKRYNVQAITQLKEDVYPAFANDIRALGATL